MCFSGCHREAGDSSVYSRSGPKQLAPSPMTNDCTLLVSAAAHLVLQLEWHSTKAQASTVKFKTCVMCELAKPAADFYTDFNNVDSLHSYCIACARATHRKAYERRKQEAQASRCVTVGVTERQVATALATTLSQPPPLPAFTVLPDERAYPAC